MRWRFAPSVFFISLFCLNVAKDSTPSATPLSATFLMNLSDSSHLDPKLVARRDSVSLVCAPRVHIYSPLDIGVSARLEAGGWRRQQLCAFAA